MRKTILIIILIMLYFNNKAYCYQLTNQDKILVNKLTYSINTKISDKPISEKIKYKNLLNKLVIKNSKNEKLKLIIIQTLKQTKLYNYNKEYENHYSNNNINYQYIKNKWLEWHNTEREKIKLTKYTYDDRLDNTSYQWSQYQSEVWIMTHERNTWDWFYNYKIIEKWFEDRLVKCQAKWWVTSSESIWKFWYYCSNNDCSNKLEESLKVIFDIYMAEKNLPRSENAHYRAITHKDLRKIWLWLYINKTSEKDYYEYYVTTHYCTNFIN